MSESNAISVSLSKFTSPKIIETKNQDFVEYGEDNDYFGYLIDRANRSTTNKAILTGISNLIFGKGLDATDAGKKAGEWASLMAKVRPKDLRKIITDRKILGMASIQVVYQKGEVKNLEHFPMNTLRPAKKNEDGQIEVWYYHPNWKDYKRSDTLEEVKAYGFGNGNEPEIYIWGDYVTGSEYFTPPDYIGALPYALLEEEIADYQINDAQNGFSPTTIVNFNNGVPEDQEKRRELERDVKSKITGTKGKKVVISFNDSKENQTEVNSIPLNDAPQHYEYLSKECFNKLIVGHRVTSPMLLGIRDGQSGLGNNADEIKNATLLFENIVIRVFQNQLVDIIKEITGTTLDLYFKTIQPLEFMQVEGVSEDEEEKQTGVELKLAEQKIDSLVADNLISKGEDLSEEWGLIESGDAEMEAEEKIAQLVEEANKKASKSETLLHKAIRLAKTGTARPNAGSTRDDKTAEAQFKVRYEYSPNKVSANSREFCRKMVAAKKIYRREDLAQMSRDPAVNPGFGPNGTNTYDIFKYKGGANCSHRFVRKVFMKKDPSGGIDINSPIANTLITSIREARSNGYDKGIDPDYNTAKTRPKDMPNNGFLNPRG